MTCSTRVPGPATDRFQHEAVFYRGLDDLASTVVPFVREGIEANEPVMVATLPDRIEVLEHEFGADAARILFVDMAELGGNPARIIPAWRQFVSRAPIGARVRGVGEPVWSGRREVELEECILHESLINVAFDAGPAWRLMCPYDVESLPRSVLEDALRTHPVVETRVDRRIHYAGHHHALAVFGEPLPDAPARADEVQFYREDLSGLRDMVRRLAGRAGVDDERADDIMLAAHELATNSVVHGGGMGRLRTWNDPGAFVVEVSDSGRIQDPLVGRGLTSGLAENGRGVWMANQLCDLVQVRSTDTGTVVRLFAWLY